jgi:hypothetical protein
LANFIIPYQFANRVGSIGLSELDENFEYLKNVSASLVDESVAPVDNVLYVAKNGSDSNNGETLVSAFLTIKAALAVATAGTTIFVKSGDYTENNPVTIPTGVSIVGDNLRTTTVRPLNQTQDLFYVNNGCYATGFTFRDHLSPAAAFAFNPNGSAGFITTSPYIQNCSSITTTGTGMRINGSHVTGLRSMVSDAYTQINQGGIGIHLLNRGYAQLVSIFTVCCNISILCEYGGQCSITNSNTSFGTFGLKAEGVSAKLYSGTTLGASQSGDSIVVNNLTTRPSVGEVVKFSNDPTYYTVRTSTALDNGASLITFEEDIDGPLLNGTIADFYQKSFISASAHTFEYVGTGDNLITALPQSGGVPIQENEIQEGGGGKVFYTSTDHVGDFRIGNDLTINRADGTIEGRTFRRSLFSALTPYILAIEG